MAATERIADRGLSLAPEKDDGNIEYKRHLIHDDLDRINQLTTQLSFRLHEGGGFAQYRIGVEDDGSLSKLNIEELDKSIVMLELMVESISAKVSKVTRCDYTLRDMINATQKTTSVEGAAPGVGMLNQALFDTDLSDKMVSTAGDDNTTTSGSSLDMADKMDCDITSTATETYYYALVDVETSYDDTSKVDVRIAVCGNVDAGKSTCIGVMKNGVLDDGRGSARTSTMIHQHEIESGRTSTVSHHVVGFRADGKIANYDQGCRQPSIESITQNSVRLMTFIDLAGHEKYLRSMIYGVSSSLLDYSLVLVNARAGVTHMTHHHLTVCAMMNIPMILLFTKTDGCPQHRMKQTVEETRELLKAPDIRKRLVLISPEATGSTLGGAGKQDKRCRGNSFTDTTDSEADKQEEEGKEKHRQRSLQQNVRTALGYLSAARQVGIPAFNVSFVEGTNLEFLRRVFRFLPKRRKHSEKKSEELEFIADRLYSVPGVGPVLYGFVNQGTVAANTSMWFGPLTTGEFVRTTVKTVHYNCLPVKTVAAGNFCCLAVKLNKEQLRHVRRGMVLTPLAPRAVMRFKAKINIVYNQHTTIKRGYTPYLHILMVRQSAVVEDIETVRAGITAVGSGKTEFASGDLEPKEKILRPGDMSVITFRFAHRCEFVRSGMRIMFRDGKVKGIGLITEVLHNEE